MINSGELAIRCRSNHELYHGAETSSGGAKGQDVPAAVKIHRRVMPKDVPLQCIWTLQDAVLKGVKCNDVSEEDRRISVRKGRVATRGKDSTAEW